MSWENLEDLMTQLLMLDKAMTVPGSGNGKSEEDVIGLSTITQCKYSEAKNISILRKDVDRLMAAAKLQNKIPIFVTETRGLKLISIPESIIFKDVLNIIVGMSLTRFVQTNLSKIKTSEERVEYKKLISRATQIIDAVHAKYIELADDCMTSLNKENELSLEWTNHNQTNLFEE